MNVDTGSFRSLQARADAAATAAGDVAGLGELVSGLAAEVAVLATTLSTFADDLTVADAVRAMMLSARRDGLREGRAEHDPHQAAAQAQQRRAGLRLVEGGSTRKHGAPAAHARAAGPGDSQKELTP